MNKILLILSALLFVGCRSNCEHTVLVSLAGSQPLPAAQQATVWSGDQVAAYSVGRYVDPSDRNVVHEAHTVYRREQTCHPNLTPPSGLVFPTPDTPGSSVTNATAFLHDALTAELNQQRALSRQVLEQSQSLQRHAEQINGQANAIRESLADYPRIRTELERMTNRLNQLEQRA